MKYLYPIEFVKNGKKKYFFGETDINEEKVKRIGICKSDKCAHNTPVEASDCYRQYLLDNEWTLKGGVIGERKCYMKKCANMTTQVACLGDHIEYPLCDEHRNKATAKTIGWGFVLNLKRPEEGDE